MKKNFLFIYNALAVKKMLFFSGVMFFLSVINVYAQSIPELMYFKFNTSTSGNVPNEAQAATRVSANGTLSGTTIGGAGQFGTALQGNGGATASNSLNANWATNLSGPWTISLWMKGITNGATNNYIFGGTGGSTFRAFTGSGLVAGAGNIWVRGTGMTDVKINNIFDASGTAVVLHLVYDNTVPEIRVYINGSYSSSQSQTATMTLTGTDFTVGGQAASNGIPNGSLIDEFRMYNRALTATEIAATWNVELNPGPPCPPPTNITITNVNSSSVDFSWTGVTGSVGYEYVVDQNAAGPTGTPITAVGTSGNAIGLAPSTQYYIHVRNLCSPTNWSAWTTLPFTSNPPCDVPGSFIFNYIDSDSARFSWASMGTPAVEYEYLVDQDTSAPGVGAPTIVTTNNFGDGTGLMEGQTYYVHLRTKCTGSDSSAWGLFPFYAPIICKDPQVKFNDIRQDQAVAYWGVINSAIAYEYLLDNNAFPPATGTRITKPSVLLSYLNPSTKYYFHVRSFCSDRGVLTNTDWKTFELNTKGVGIDDVQGSIQASAYPNPTSGEFVFSVHDRSNGLLTVTDISGREIKKIDVVSEKTSVSLSDVPSGVYVLKYASDNFAGSYRIVKQ